MTEPNEGSDLPPPPLSDEEKFQALFLVIDKATSVINGLTIALTHLIVAVSDTSRELREVQEKIRQIQNR